MNLESTSYWQYNLTASNSIEAAVETEFVITVTFLGYYTECS